MRWPTAKTIYKFGCAGGERRERAHDLRRNFYARHMCFVCVQINKDSSHSLRSSMIHVRDFRQRLVRISIKIEHGQRSRTRNLTARSPALEAVLCAPRLRNHNTQLTQHVVLLGLVAAADHPDDAAAGQLRQHHAAAHALDHAGRRAATAAAAAVRVTTVAAAIAAIAAVLVRIGDVLTEVRGGRHFVERALLFCSVE